MKIWIFSPRKPPRAAEGLAKVEGDLKRTEERVIGTSQSTNITNILASFSRKISQPKFLRRWRKKVDPSDTSVILTDATLFYLDSSSKSKEFISSAARSIACWWLTAESIHRNCLWLKGTTSFKVTLSRWGQSIHDGWLVHVAYSSD